MTIHIMRSGDREYRVIMWEWGDIPDFTSPDIRDARSSHVYCGNCGMDVPGCGCPRDPEFLNKLGFDYTSCYFWDIRNQQCHYEPLILGCHPCESCPGDSLASESKPKPSGMKGDLYRPNKCNHAPDDGCEWCCQTCNYDRHFCPGCGTVTDHRNTVCPECAQQ